MIPKFKAWDKNKRCIKDVDFTPKGISFDDVEFIPFIKGAVDELNMDIKNNPGLKYEIVGYSICKDETLCITISSILVHWEGTPFRKE